MIKGHSNEVTATEAHLLYLVRNAWNDLGLLDHRGCSTQWLTFSISNGRPLYGDK